MYECMNVCMYGWMYVCMFAYMYVWIYVHGYIMKLTVKLTLGKNIIIAFC